MGAAMNSLEYSLRTLCDYAAVHGRELVLEPGDTAVQAFQLIGSTDKAVALCELMRREGRTLGLTMDVSHTAQLGEDVHTAFTQALPLCQHIHLANCILKPDHPLYGDKHPVMSDPDAVFSFSEIKELAVWCRNQYGDKELTLSFEVICHEDDQAAFFEKILREEEWFFSL